PSAGPSGLRSFARVFSGGSLQLRGYRERGASETMTGDGGQRAFEAARPLRAGAYDPFARGPFPAGVRTLHALDARRARRVPCEPWYPAAARHAGEDLAPATRDSFTVPPSTEPRTQLAVRAAAALPGTHPLVVFSHGTAPGARRMATYLCTHLASHGYVVAALDHSEVVAAELARGEGESADRRAARVQAWIASRVPDVRFLLDHLLSVPPLGSEARLDPARIGIAGYSFGGWTALAAPEDEPRLGAVVALAPGGSSRPKPGIIPAALTFDWGRDVPVLHL